MPITKSIDLVTSKKETRAGFIEFALEKNKRSAPYIESAKAFHHFASKAKNPTDLIAIKEIREQLLTAAGLSDKSLKYFTEEDKTFAINELIKNFLEPAGKEFVDEVVYRFLLIKGDTLGGSMRNIIGALAQQKLIRALLTLMNGTGINYKWLSIEKKASWQDKPSDDYELENKIKAISWTNKNATRTLAFNLKSTIVGKNIDICLFSCSHTDFGNSDIVNNNKTPLMYGELKGGIDPAGADEHWKTANTALERIRKAYLAHGNKVFTSFVGAAIENDMAEEIFLQLKNNILTYAANLTKSDQLYEYCTWLLNI